MPLYRPDNSEAPVLSQFSLKGKVAAVTGGARGIGLEIVRGLAEAGAAVAIIYSTSSSAHIAAHDIAATTGVKVAAFQGDVRSRAGIAETVSKIAADFGRLDIMVANAGVCADIPSLEYTEETWQQNNGVNYDGVMWTAQAAGNIFKAQGRGNLIITASVSASLVNIPQQQAAYNASKAAVVQLAKVLAVEWVDFARVNCVSPGFIETDMLYNQPNERMEQWISLIPGRRMAATSELKGWRMSDVIFHIQKPLAFVSELFRNPLIEVQKQEKPERPGVANNDERSNANALSPQNIASQVCLPYQEALENHSVLLGLLRRIVINLSTPVSADSDPKRIVAFVAHQWRQEQANLYIKSELTEAQLCSHARLLYKVHLAVEANLRGRGVFPSTQCYIREFRKQACDTEKLMETLRHQQEDAILHQEQRDARKRDQAVTERGGSHHVTLSNQASPPASDEADKPGDMPGVNPDSKTLEFAAIQLGQVEEMRFFILAHPHIVERKEIHNLISVAYWDIFTHRGMTSRALNYIRHAMVLVHASFAESNDGLKNMLVAIGTEGSQWKAEFEADVRDKRVQVQRAAAAAAAVQKDEETMQQRGLADPTDILTASRLESDRESLRNWQVKAFSLATYEPPDDSFSEEDFHAHANEGPG